MAASMTSRRADSPAIRASAEARTASSSRTRPWSTVVVWSRSWRRARASLWRGVDLAVASGGPLELRARRPEPGQLDRGGRKPGQVGRRAERAARLAAAQAPTARSPRCAGAVATAAPTAIAERRAGRAAARARRRRGVGRGRHQRGGNEVGGRRRSVRRRGRGWSLPRTGAAGKPLACWTDVRSRLHLHRQRHRRRPTEPPRQAERPGPGHVPGHRRGRRGPEGRPDRAGRRPLRGGERASAPGSTSAASRPWPRAGAARGSPRPRDESLGAIGDTGGRITHLGQQAAWVWQELGVPVIAAVHGAALGGGLQIALGADIRIVAPDAKLSVLEARWGLIPDMTGHGGAAHAGRSRRGQGADLQRPDGVGRRGRRPRPGHPASPTILGARRWSWRPSSPRGAPTRSARASDCSTCRARARWRSSSTTSA